MGLMDWVEHGLNFVSIYVEIGLSDSHRLLRLQKNIFVLDFSQLEYRI